MHFKLKENFFVNFRPKPKGGCIKACIASFLRTVQPLIIIVSTGGVESVMQAGLLEEEL